ncbi:DUF637 domain-containing protein [Pseudomonas panipatensis]|uniref:DUF637 domain-containing protein n=1 Tax=Pseudomonas panipatensis TaxID=428992 RepID=UPI0035ADEDD2
MAAGWANVALSAGAASLASTGAVSTINNKGNLGTALSDTFSGDSLKQAMIAGAVGGLTTGYFDDWVGTKTRFVDGKVVVDLGGVDGASRFAANQALQNLSGAALNKATGGSASFSDALKNSLYNTFAAVGFNAVGDFGKTHKLETGGEQMVVLHALMGGLAAEARGESFAAGAAAAGLNEAVVKDLDALVSSYSPENRAALLSMSSQLVGLVATVAQDPTADTGKLETGAWVAQNATQYNHELHRNNAKSFVDGALDFCRQKPDACSSGAAQLTQQDVIAALEATAAHGEGIEKVKPEALELVNQFLNNPDLADTLQKDLFSYTESERKRLAVNDTAELAIAGLSLAQAAKAVLMGNGGALAKIASGLRQEAADGAKGTAGSVSSATASSATNASRLNMQLVAEQAAGARAPTQITGYSSHAVEQIAGRDGGIGVSQSALTNAWTNPLKIEYVPSKYGPTFKYTGGDAVIVVNTDGKVVTGWAKSSSGTGK